MALQIEINKRLFLDPATGQVLSQRAAELRGRLETAFARVAELL